MRESNHPQPGLPQPAADDLQKIAGIGATLATRLAGAGVIRYLDLASATPARLAAIARVSPQKIVSQDWIGQARRLADDVPGAAETSEPEGQQSYATFHVELLIDADNTVRRTKTRHYQTDTEDSWPGWDDQHLIAVIRRKAGLGDPGRRPARPRPTQPPPIHVEGPGPAEEGTRGTFRVAGQPTAVRHHHQQDDRPLGHHRSLGGLVHIADHHAQQRRS
jgi:hypothetical protein